MDQSPPTKGPYALHLHRSAVTGKSYPAVAGDGWRLTHTEEQQGARRVELPPDLRHADPAVLLQLWYDGKLDCSGSMAVLTVVRDVPSPACFPEDGLEGG
jgi:hypothetical protein